MTSHGALIVLIAACLAAIAYLIWHNDPEE